VVGPADDHGGRSGGAIWVDDAEIDPRWSAPSFVEPEAPQSVVPGEAPPPEPMPEPESGRRHSRWLTIGVPLLALALLVSIVAVAGGFRARTDETITMQPGTRFTTGPYEFVFSKATIQEVNSYGDFDRAQQVVVTGTARNTWTESLRPDVDQFAATGGGRGEVVEADYVQQSSSADAWNSLTPGLPPQPIQVEFEFRQDFDPNGKILMVVSDLTYGDHSALQVGNEETWYNHGDRYLLHFPVKRLPAEEVY
jgi:hypothetical protein